jgi:hypothetical protein
MARTVITKVNIAEKRVVFILDYRQHCTYASFDYGFPISAKPRLVCDRLEHRVVGKGKGIAGKQTCK